MLQESHPERHTRHSWDNHMPHVGRHSYHLTVTGLHDKMSAFVPPSTTAALHHTQARPHRVQKFLRPPLPLKTCRRSECVLTRYHMSLSNMNDMNNMNNMNNLNPKAPKTDKQEVKVSIPEKELSDEDERLQYDKPFMVREFGKVTAVAVVIGIILFFFDILVSLSALSLGAIYALAVLFDARFFTNFVHQLFASANNFRRLAVTRFQSAWSSVLDSISKS